MRNLQKAMNIKELENKLVKHYWTNCLDPNTGEIDLTEINGDTNFDCIQRNSKGKIQLEIGELRDIVHNTIKKTIRHIGKSYIIQRNKMIEEDFLIKVIHE